MRLSSVVASLVAAVSAQGSTQGYTDPSTGIAFQTYTADKIGAKFGIAMPAGPGTDFIGQIVRLLSLQICEKTTNMLTDSTSNCRMGQRQFGPCHDRKDAPSSMAIR